MSEVKLYTRRDLARLATVGIIVGTAGGAGGVMRSMLGLRGAMMSNNVDPEEEMYKELFVGMCADTWPEDVTIPVTEIRRSFCFVSSTVKIARFPNVTDIRNLSGSNPFYNCPNFDSIYLPNVTELRGSPILQFGQNYYFDKPLTFPDAYPLNNHSSSVVCTIHLNQTHDTVQGASPFPFTNIDAVKSHVTFACTDGNLTYNGTTWDFTPNA